MRNSVRFLLELILELLDKDIYVKKSALETYQNLPVYLYFHGGAFLAGSWLYIHNPIDPYYMGLIWVHKNLTNQNEDRMVR